MNGQAIAAQPISHAGLRALATEQFGPRPQGTSAERTPRQPADPRTCRATRP